MNKKEKSFLKQLKEVHNLIYLSKLSSGNFNVYSLWDYRCRQSVAIKIHKNSKESEFAASHWIECKHPHLVSLLWVVDFKDGYTGYVMPLLENPIRKVIAATYASDPRSFERAKKWTYQLLTGLCYLHDQNLCHLRIKTDNVLIDKDDNAVLIGFSKIRYNGEAFDMEGEGGSIYTPPEHRLSKKPENLSGQKTDVWCLGVTAMNIFLGREFRKKTRWWKDIFSPSKDHVSQFVKTIADKGHLERMLKKAHACSSVTSIDAEKACSFFNQFLKEDRNGRCTSRDALCHSFIWPYNKFQVGVTDRNLPKIHRDDDLDEQLYSLPRGKTAFTMPKGEQNSKKIDRLGDDYRTKAQD